MSRLSVLRRKLAKTNIHIFQALRKRQNLIRRIVTQKKRDEHQTWDLEQERRLFSKQSEHLGLLSLEELFAFSLIMESQSYHLDPSYPRWSQGEHLAEIHEFFERMNPLLLAMFYKERYAGLKLKPRYQNVHGKEKLFSSHSH